MDCPLPITCTHISAQKLRRIVYLKGFDAKSLYSIPQPSWPELEWHLPFDQPQYARVVTRHFPLNESGENSKQISAIYSTNLGRSILGLAEDILESPPDSESLEGQVDLIFTSPPFPLNRKKRYGNEQGQAYVDWLASFAPLFRKLLRPKGSIVLELGNAWEPGRPVMSTLALKALLAFLERGELTLCQQFVWYNPARLPSPAQWVNVERIRVKDAYTHLWWMALTDRPHADNRQVLNEYSQSMQQLLKRQSYNTGKRPSEHNIGKKSFLKDNAGSIPSNLITLANTKANSDYLNYCRRHEIQPHPARMPSGLAEFFIKFLTKTGNLVLDPFAGSNTTGAVAEELDRRWLAIEPNETYLKGSRGRFKHFNGDASE